MPAGRPIEDIPKDIADKIIDWIADGKSLRSFCKIEGHPSFKTVYEWIAKDKEFSTRYAEARDIGTDQIAQEALEIIDSESERIVGEGGSSRIDPSHVKWMQNRAELRLKLLAKWNPKRYGDRQVIAGDPEAPLFKELSDEERAQKLAAIMQAAEARIKK